MTATEKLLRAVTVEFAACPSWKSMLIEAWMENGASPIKALEIVEGVAAGNRWTFKGWTHWSA